MAAGTPGQDARERWYRHRRRRYFQLMGLALGLIVLAWFVVRLWSVPAAVAMSLVAAVIPPVAAVVANARDEPGG